MYFTLSADGDKACQDPSPDIHGGSRIDPLTCMSSYNIDVWNERCLILVNRGRGWWLFGCFDFSVLLPSASKVLLLWKHGLRLTSYTRGLRLLKIQCVLWAFVSRWDNVGLINCLAGTNNSLDEKLWGLINNNAVKHYILLSKFIPAEKQTFTVYQFSLGAAVWPN